MLKRWIAIAGVLALAIATSLLLVSCKSNSPATGSTGGPAGTPSVVGTGQANGKDYVPTGTVSATGGVQVGSVTGDLRPFEPLPDPKIKAKPAKTPEPKGEKLAPLTSAPANTLSGLKLDMIPDGSRYTIVMRPYGIGPDMLLGSRLVIHVDSATPVGSAPVLSQIVDANVLALADTGNGGSVTRGGTYNATLTFRSDGSKMLPILSNAKLAD